MEWSFDRLVQQVRTGLITRLEFMANAAFVGASLPLVISVLSDFSSADLDNRRSGDRSPIVAYPNANVSPAGGRRFPDGWRPYPWSWGQSPIADNPDDAAAWWLARIADMSVPDTDPAVVLSSDEVAQLRTRRPRVGHGWYSLAVPAIQGWQRFWDEKVREWAAPSIVNFDVEATEELQLLGAKLLIDQGIIVAGNLSFDWVLFNDAMKEYHLANVATTSIVAPASIYYPTTSICMDNAAADFADLVKPVAERLREEGFSEVDAVWLTEQHPSWWSVSRRIGFNKGLADPANQAVCKINVIETIPVVENDSAQAAAAAALAKYPNLHLLIMLGHQYAGAAAAVRAHDRKDVWVVACDLDEFSATSLLNGGWPVCATYSLPIAQLGRAEANVMGKLLLGKQVPLIVLSKGTVATPRTVAEAYAHDWGGAHLQVKWSR